MASTSKPAKAKPRRATTGSTKWDVILEGAEVDGMAGVFVLGCLDRRVTLYSQQVRALNLVWALAKAGRLRGRIAIIGAGAAGMSAAAAATVRKAEVVIFERADGPLHLQMGCKTRWLHPRVYDWPADDWDSSDARLPIMNWVAGTADKVAGQLTAGYTTARAPKPIFGVRQLEIVDAHQPRADKRPRWRLVWSTEKTSHDERFDAVILAVGFGIERDVEFAPRGSYWRVDTLGQTPLEPSGRSTFLVSGTGDGGLIDMMRCKLRPFEHEDMIELFFRAMDVRAQEKRILDIEKRAIGAHKTHGEARANELITQEYYALVTDKRVPKSVVEKIEVRLRDDPVILLGLDPSPLTIRTAMYNRFLAAFLLQRGVEYRVGELVDVEPRGFRYRAKIAGATAASRGRTTVIDDLYRVVVRHGAESALQKYFPGIHEKVKGRTPSAEMPVPEWEDDFYKIIHPKKKEAPVVPAPVANAAKWRFVATFELDLQQRPMYFESGGYRHYWVELALEQAPTEISSVEYKLYEDYAVPKRRVLRPPKFAEVITSYGDFVVTVTLSDKTAIEQTLAQALADGHRNNSNESIAEAIARLKKY